MIHQLRALAARLRGLFGDRRADQELDEEIETHLRLLAERYVRQGMAEAEAALAARRQFGNVTLLQEANREMRGFRVIDTLVQDLRYGVRILAKQPGYTAVAMLALALGIGVNTAILSAVNGVVLRPLPVDEPTELITPHWGRQTDAQVWGQFSYPNYVDLRDENRSFSELCAWDQTSAVISSGESHNAGDGERAEVVWGELVSGNYFDVMGVKPALGRGFLPEEDRRPNARPVVVLSHSLWQRRFNSDRDVAGKTVYLNGLPFTVVGVMPESFLGSIFFSAIRFGRPR